MTSTPSSLKQSERLMMRRRKRNPKLEAKQAAAHQKRQLFAELAHNLTPLDVKVVFHRGNFGRAFLEKRKISVPYVTTVESLQIYLHELGHLRHPDEDNSEGEYRAEAYSFKMLRCAGISLPSEWRKAGIAYVGWHVVHDVLDDRIVSEEALSFVGLKGVHRITIARAHIMACKRVVSEMSGNRPSMPVDAKYWDAVLAALPAATLSTAAEIEAHEREQQAMLRHE